TFLSIGQARIRTPAIEQPGDIDQVEIEQVRKRGLPPLVQSKQRRGQAPLPDLFYSLVVYCVCLVLPASRSIACGSTGAMTAKLSFTAFGDPGRLTISVPERTPQTPREIIAIGVTFNDSARIASAIPGASRSIISWVASGVLSRGPRPVPPVVMIRFTSSRSAKSIRDSINGSRSSERILLATISAPRSVRSWTKAAPEASSRSPRAQASLAVITTALILDMIYKIFQDLHVYPEKSCKYSLQLTSAVGAYVFLEPAAIHHDHQPRILRTLRRRRINHTLLQPHRLRTHSNRLINSLPRLIRSSKHIHKIDLFRHRRQIRIRLLTKHSCLIRVHGNHPVTLTPHVSRNTV